MNTYPQAFDAAVNHAMIYEVGAHWDSEALGVAEGLIDTKQQRRAVGYVNDPRDAGGETKFGVAKNANPDLNITTLTWEQAKEVYYRRYWLTAKCDRINELSPRLAVLHFDGAVNHGVGRAAKFLQQAVHVSVDGAIGPGTLRALSTAISQMGDIELCNVICSLREQFYRDIVDAKPTQSVFLNGWLRRINEMRDFTTDADKSFD